MSERDNLEKTLKMARRVLTMLEQQAAGHTSLSMPAELMIRLEDKRSEVAELEARLEALSSPVSSPNIGPPLSQSTGISASERKYLRQYLTSRFSLGELKTLAFDLGLDYETMPHQTKADFPQALIAYCERLGPQTLKELLQAGLELRSDEGVGEILVKLT